MSVRVLCARCALWLAPAPAHIVQTRRAKIQVSMHVCACLCVKVVLSGHHQLLLTLLNKGKKASVCEYACVCVFCVQFVLSGHHQFLLTLLNKGRESKCV